MVGCLLYGCNVVCFDKRVRQVEAVKLRWKMLKESSCVIKMDLYMLLPKAVSKILLSNRKMTGMEDPDEGDEEDERQGEEAENEVDDAPALLAIPEPNVGGSAAIHADRHPIPHTAGRNIPRHGQQEQQKVCIVYIAYLH